jgi:hypothetical protein
LPLSKHLFITICSVSTSFATLLSSFTPHFRYLFSQNVKTIKHIETMYQSKRMNRKEYIVLRVQQVVKEMVAQGEGGCRWRHCGILFLPSDRRGNNPAKSTTRVRDWTKQRERERGRGSSTVSSSPANEVETVVDPVSGRKIRPGRGDQRWLLAANSSTVPVPRNVSRQRLWWPSFREGDQPRWEAPMRIVRPG